MDELAYQLGIDPVELRLRNHADGRPQHGHPWSQRRARGVLRLRRRPLRLADRDPDAAAARDGNWLIGTGMAAAGYPVAFFMPPQRARARLYADGSAVVQAGTQEFGTGVLTAMTQVAADALGVSAGRTCRFEYGDTDLPNVAAAVGSAGAGMISAAVHAAGTALRDQLIAQASPTPTRRCTAPTRRRSWSVDGPDDAARPARRRRVATRT